MTANEILKADMLDIIFDNRNKLYGAYTIRKFYNNRLLIAVTLAVAFVLLTVLVLATTNTNKLVKNDEIVDVTPIVLPVEKTMEKPVEKTRQQAAAPVAQKKFSDNIKIKTDDQVTELAPDMKSLEEAIISNATVAGMPVEAALSSPSGMPSAATGTGESDKENKFTVPDSSPEFPGGQTAWIRFLNKYLKAPEELQTGEKKTVMVRFFVSVEESIDHFEVVQSGGAAFDNEVIRVLQKMPKWKPAVQHGHPVPVTFTQPVTFVGMEE